MHMLIPYDKNLKIEYLSRIFDGGRVFTCYKFFWFLAILEKIEDGKTSFTYDELITEMIADAWYMVSEYHLQLGPNNSTDNLEEVVKYLFNNIFGEKISSKISKEKLLEKIGKLTDKRYIEYKETLTNNVPYCLQTPFFDPKNPKLADPKRNTIQEINLQNRLLYYFENFNNRNKLSTTIKISDEWVGYLVRNREILQDWTRHNLVRYLQKRNPSVPGIIDKIMPPVKRDLKHATDYWKTIIAIDGSLKDIYGDFELTEIKMTIDHFVPWQYVAHDELWNLSPTTRKINSAKSNYLPDWDAYFDRLSRLEYSAYSLSNKYDVAKEAFEKCAVYHINNFEIRNELYKSGLSMEDFQIRLYNVVRPVYDSAKNCGFREGWEYVIK